MNKIKVLIVDDSLLFRTFLSEALSSVPNFEIIGTAVDAFDAKLKIPMLKPDVITMDIEMPRMNGIDFLKQILPQYPIPTVLVSSLNISVFEALSSGAVDFVRKPTSQNDSSAKQQFISDLAAKIIVASTAKVRMPRSLPTVANAGMSASNSGLKDLPIFDKIFIALGASTGGTEATVAVLKDLPPHTPGIVIVQHMPAGFTKMYADRINNTCPMSGKEAQDGDKIIRGRVLVAPGSMQMRVVKRGGDYYVTCAPGEKVSGHCPSVDVLFESCAQSAGKDAIGIIMTGMGQDGAKGMLAMRQKGSHTIGQDKDSSVVYGMPKVAYDMGGVCVQASCDDISKVLKTHLNGRG